MVGGVESTVSDTPDREHELPRFKHGLIDHLFVIRWIAKPGVDDMATIVQHLSEARRAVGAPLFVLEIIPDGIPLPGAREIASTRGHLRALKQLREEHFVAIEQRGPLSSVIRGIFDAVAYAVIDLPTFCTSTDEALVLIARRLGTGIGPLRQKLADSALLG